MFFDSWAGLGRVVVVGMLAYIALVFLLRISGKRTLSKMNAFDFIVTVALGSTLATVLLSKDVALVEGVLAFTLLIFLQFAITWLSVRSKAVRGFVKAEPSLLVHRGLFLPRALKAERVTEEEIYAAIRAQGIGSLEDVEAVVLETDGSFTTLQSVGAGDKNALNGVAATAASRSRWLFGCTRCCLRASSGFDPFRMQEHLSVWCSQFPQNNSVSLVLRELMQPVLQKRGCMKTMKIVKFGFPFMATLFVGLSMSAPLDAQTRGRRQSNIVVNSSEGINQSYFVNGRTVSIRGSNNRIRLTGYSSFVRVTGTNNVVTVDAARAISVSGRNNRVTWRRRANGVTPRISRTGVGNQVSRSK